MPGEGGEGDKRVWARRISVLEVPGSLKSEVM